MIMESATKQEKLEQIFFLVSMKHPTMSLSSASSSSARRLIMRVASMTSSSRRKRRRH
jgi:hypothetical protein